MARNPRDHGVDGIDFVTDEVTGLEEYQFADDVKESLKEMGISDVTLQQPQLEDEHAGIFPDLDPGDYFDGRMPNVLKRLDLDQLSALSGLMNNWHQYIVSKRSLVGVEKSEAARQRKFILSLVRSHYKDSGMASSDKEAEERANQDFRFITADKALAMAEIKYKALDDHVALAKTNMSTLSRELSNINTKLNQDAIGGGRPAERFRPWKRGEDDGAEREEKKNPEPAVSRRIPGRFKKPNVRTKKG